MVRQAQDERTHHFAVRPEFAEGLDQSFSRKLFGLRNFKIRFTCKENSS